MLLTPADVARLAEAVVGRPDGAGGKAVGGGRPAVDGRSGGGADRAGDGAGRPAEGPGFWRAPFAGASIDSRTVGPGELFIPIRGERFDGHDFVREAFARGARASLWQKDHGPPPEGGLYFIVSDTRQALLCLGRENRRRFGGPVVAVTGSNGKTTAKTLLAAALSTRYRVLATEGNQNNEIGLPLMLLRLSSLHELSVLEMGMNHAGEIRRLSEAAEPDVGVVLNIGEAHIGLLGSRAAIAEAKLELLFGLSPAGDLFYPAAEPLVTDHPAVRAYPGRRWPVGDGGRVAARLVDDLGWDGTVWAVRVDGGAEVELRVPLPGEALGTVGVFAFAVARLFGVGPEAASAAWRNLPPLPGRMRRLRGRGGMTLIDDAYNAAPTSVRAAVRTLAKVPGYRHRVAVLGEMYELGPHGPALLQALAEEPAFQAVEVLTVGREIALLAEALRARGRAARHFEAEEALLAALSAYARPEAIVLVKGSRAAGLERIVAALSAPDGVGR
ncbi:MAG: UDP-N-acetylmuramoylalanyl-D-glutamyl-2, 6-diaminopimelate--D-alanyl-D-alanine ligase [Hydrogenibacillus schlegelii]|uniref:UDP-N-acetylmuramoyl-tripeptide--D-alanyl-D-alanine ligase n=1 Tax=Hydrogenibacillus schlegelii TaxID=1484 RepID=A0A2T5GF19_HYDSH|nr:UDP-N-acetylmuramoyl-tripeptide--D-alanyl-D-alanine ligase [Hydrogenibacillus schlegelii]PTQ54781.1 MAG: UDP-N-acetylmuramoylalanyl-D-glutamyl-2, 6-diaminopimelate--D-alanyl-D-alanine ligase [Hydrogenibacillus schlegelii]